MTRRQLNLAGIFILTVFLAFTVRDVVEALIIIPLAYLWWLLKLSYAALPQIILWALLIVFAVYSTIITIIPKIGFRASGKVEIKIKQGQLEILADWLKKSRSGGTYYKWLIANRLGKNAREILAQREGNPVTKKIGALGGLGWNPPREIESYLDSGLNGSFADFPYPRWFWQSPPPTPLDVDAQQVMDYLEDEMEMANDRDSKSI